MDRESGEDSEVRCTTGSEKTRPQMMVTGAGSQGRGLGPPEARFTDLLTLDRGQPTDLCGEPRARISRSGATQPLSRRPKSVVDFRKQTQIISRNELVWLFQ